MLEFKDSSTVEFGDTESVDSSTPVRVFDSLIQEFLSDLSSNIMGSTKAKGFPDLVSFAFWCRGSNVSLMKKRYSLSDFRIGLGKILHITPRNVPMNFAFSWALSLLAGNSNYVKLPSKDFTQIDLFLQSYSEVVSSPRYTRIKASTVFFRTEHSSTLLKLISARSQARVIWGSDQTIRAIKLLDSPVRSFDLVFPSRLSIAVISSDIFLSSKSVEKQIIVKRFLQDSLTFGQMGCSSPRMLFWKGNKVSYKDTRSEFWNLANALAPNFMQITDPYSRLVNLATISIKDSYTLPFTSPLHAPLITFQADHEFTTSLQDVLSLGTFLEYQVDNYEEIFVSLNRSLQTITYFGIEPKELLTSIESLGFLGVDRIVPFGTAYEMTPVWDGTDTITSLSRIIEIR